MSSNLQKALECFDENLRSLGSPATNPEKHNLYTGLAGLTEGVIQLQEGIKILLNQVEEVKRFLS